MANTEPARKRDPHGWNSLENYAFLHDKRLSEHPLVLPGSSIEVSVFPTPEAPYDAIVIGGLIMCSNGIYPEVQKQGDIDRTPARKVRMNLYRYNAWFPGGHNVLRYDNLHKGNDYVYHRHLFDKNTGEEIEFREMAKEEFPVMHQILDELYRLFPPGQP